MQTKSLASRIHRAVRARRGVAVAVAALAGATLIGACGSSSPPASSTPANSTPTAILNMHTIVRSIEHSILIQRHIHTTVTCPAVVPQQKGRNFACIAKTRGSTNKTPVAVTQQNDSGYVTYRVE